MVEDKVAYTPESVDCFFKALASTFVSVIVGISSDSLHVTKEGLFIHREAVFVKGAKEALLVFSMLSAVETPLPMTQARLFFVSSDLGAPMMKVCITHGDVGIKGFVN